MQIRGSFSGAQQQALVSVLMIWHLLPISQSCHHLQPHRSGCFELALPGQRLLCWFLCTGPCVHHVSYWLVLELGFWLLCLAK